MRIGLVLLAACSGASTSNDASTDAPPSNAIGGDIYLLYQTVSGAPTVRAAAEFYSAFTPATGGKPYPYALSDLQMDSCAEVVLYPSPTGVYIDVGNDVTLSSTNKTITLVKLTREEQIFYEPVDPIRQVEVATQFDVSLSGVVPAQSWRAALRVQPPVIPTSPATTNNTIVLTTTMPLALTWNPTQADELEIYLIERLESSPSWRCRVTDDGAFDIPASVTDTLPTGSLMILGALQVKEQSLFGRTVYLRSSAETWIQIDRS